MPIEIQMMRDYRALTSSECSAHKSERGRLNMHLLPLEMSSDQYQGLQALGVACASRTRTHSFEWVRSYGKVWHRYKCCHQKRLPTHDCHTFSMSQPGANRVAGLQTFVSCSAGCRGWPGATRPTFFLYCREAYSNCLLARHGRKATWVLDCRPMRYE